MANLLDYLKWRGDLTLTCMPFNAVDGLILAWLANLKLDGLVPALLGDAVRALEGQPLSENNAAFVRLLAGSRRFAPMQLVRFEQRFSEEEEMQFAALTVRTGDGRGLVAFRGTDSTITGWKEDLNLSFVDEAPAQREATRYLTEAAEQIRAPLRVAGHSKGGNLAVYAAAKSPAQARIEKVLNYDGPGLNAATSESQGYRAVESRVETYLPQSALVGILLEQAEEYFVVKSDGSGVLQHDPFTWQVLPDGFELVDQLSRQSLYADRVLGDWLDSMSVDQRRTLVEALYDMVEATGASTVDELAEHWRESGWTMLDALAGLDLRTRLNLYVALGKLLRSAVRGIGG